MKVCDSEMKRISWVVTVLKFLWAVGGFGRFYGKNLGFGLGFGFLVKSIAVLMPAVVRFIIHSSDG